MKGKVYNSVDPNNTTFMEIPDAFGIVSDTHLCSIYEAIEELEEIYDDFTDRGIDTVLHCGDIVDAEWVYRGQENYIHTMGFEEQSLYAISNYPRRDKEDLKTYFISGNHGLKYFQRMGADIGRRISERRPDLEYLGQYGCKIKDTLGDSDINEIDDSLEIQLTHATGYFQTKSYGIQKYYKLNEVVDSYPDMHFFGHWHRHGWFKEHGVQAIMAGAFQHPNEYRTRRGYTSEIGGWIAEIDKDGPELAGLKMEWREKS